MIQTIVQRMASNSFLIKGWYVTLTLAGFGLFVDRNEINFLLLIVLSSLIFWTLDGYYLGVERAFRSLYNDISYKDTYRKRSKSHMLPINIEMYHHRISGTLKAMFSFPTSLIYISVIVLAGILYFKLLSF